jgi:hypothetical protein
MGWNALELSLAHAASGCRPQCDSPIAVVWELPPAWHAHNTDLVTGAVAPRGIAPRALEGYRRGEGNSMQTHHAH